jgi:hypothetical protein
LGRRLKRKDMASAVPQRQQMLWASAPEGNFESNKKRTSAAEAVCAWNSYGTAEAVPFLRTSFHSPRVGSDGGQL